ncbi:MAG: DUF362 domain-containing protein [Desulfobulbaceae bacterium]|nr:DUF362 domain-containing protein [Desulfobulbaceae bacterium]
MNLVNIDFTSYRASISNGLDAIKAGEHIAAQKSILIKPNLVNGSPHPITTPAECCEAIIEYIRNHSNAEIIIAEGCGDSDIETDEVFELLGYTAMAKKHGVLLVDLNHAPLQLLQNPACPVFPEIYLPEISFDNYIISVPVLKVHSLAKMTGTLKNMMGFAPPKYYSGRYGSWKKAMFHNKMQQSIIDLNSYLIPDLTVMDCTVGMAEFHLGGAHCDPPVNIITAGYNPWEVDRNAAELLGLDWRNVKHVAVTYE